MGGEKAIPANATSAPAGSPPRGRGKVCSAVWTAGRSGITPAWARKSVKRKREKPASQDHPRVGGEKPIWKKLFSTTQGSPPRGRGKGLTELFTLYHNEDHPRVGGEKITSRLRYWYSGGSPPRGRGKARFTSFQTACLGITPAWAGKRLKRSHRSGIFISGPIPFHSVLHRPAGSGSSRAGRDGSPAGQPQNAGPA